MNGNGVTSGAAGWLGLAAAPTFAIMAVLARVFDGGVGMQGAMVQDGSALGGMIPMYVLMAIFHAGPWLSVTSARLRRPEARFIATEMVGRSLAAEKSDPV